MHARGNIIMIDRKRPTREDGGICVKNKFYTDLLDAAWKHVRNAWRTAFTARRANCDAVAARASASSIELADLTARVTESNKAYIRTSKTV